MSAPFLLFVLLTTLSKATGTYVVSFPNSLIPGIPLSVRVLVQSSSGTVSVKAGLKYLQNDSDIIENSTSVENGKPSTIWLNVPTTLVPSKYKITIDGSGGLVFKNESKIHFEKRGLLMLIQTDKSRYSAGQIVKYRSIFLLPNLLDYQGQATISIHDGDDNRIDVIGPTQVRDGVLSGQIQLSREPVFGTWGIVLEAMGNKVQKTFEVNDYILPKFNVEISIPLAINSTQKTFTVEVKARFTFNTDVLGNCTVSIYNEQTTSKHFEMHKELNGVANFTIPMSRVNSELDTLHSIKIRAIVTDHATALTEVSEIPLYIIDVDKQQTVQIFKVDAYKNSFITGLTYHTKILVESNGRPIGKKGHLTVTPTETTANLKICNLVSPSRHWLDVQQSTKQALQIPFDEAGYANLNYHVSSRSVQKVLFSVQYSDSGTHQPFKFEVYAVPEQSTLLRMLANKYKLTAGETISLSILSSDTLDGKLTFEVYSRGMLTETHNVVINYKSSITHSFKVTEDMIPQAYVIVYHLTSSGDLISDYVLVNVKGNPLQNEVHVSYNSTVVEPGDTIRMRISADPFSTVYILAEDKKNRILGTNNDIFQTDIEQRLEQTSYNVDDNIRKSQGYYSKKRQINIERDQNRHKRSHGELGDIDDVYIESGLAVLSDAKVFKADLNGLLLFKGYSQECVAPQHHVGGGGWGLGSSHSSGTGSGSGSGTGIGSGTGTGTGIGTGTGTGIGTGTGTGIGTMVGQALTSEDVVRSKFPESWIWEEHCIGSSGEVNITKDVPDSMTSWVTSVFAVNPKTGFGIANLNQKLTVKKNFFITMDLPSSIVQGEEFLLQITVFNYLQSIQQVFLQVLLSDDPQKPIPAATQVNPGQGHSTYVHVTPKSLGTLNVLVMAKTGFFATSVSDSISRNVTIRPHGVHKSKNEQHLVDVTKGGPAFAKSIFLKDPDNMVSGTKLTKMKITGNFMVPSVEGLQNLIKMPYGCGEQTMLHFAPDIYITKYLKLVGKLTAEIKDKSEETLKTGLQRELTYRHGDGSFSAFGKRDSSGSSWLTAFVLKCFHQAYELIEIDESIMTKAMGWLLKYQQSDGSFTEPGRVIHTQMQAGTASGIKLTAFIIVSVLENRDIKGVEVSELNSAITNGKRYLESHLHLAHDAYTLSLVCYALAQAGSSSGSTCLTKLKNAALVDDDKTFWKATSSVSKRNIPRRAISTRAPSADIETSSYALLTFMKLGEISEAFPIVKWLVSQRNPTGGFQSTQDTIISLQALAEFSSKQARGPAAGYGVQFNVFSSNFSHAYSTTLATIDIVHTKELPNALDYMIFRAIGEGTAVLDITTSYYTTGSTSNDHIAVTVSLSKETINTITVHPCLKWLRQEKSGMLVMEVEMPTGFQPDVDILKAQTLIKRHETDGRNVNIYFDGVNRNGQVCVNVKVDRADPVVKSQACHVTVYDYYEPTHHAITRYESGVLKTSNICLVCPLCSFCTGVAGAAQIGVGR